MINLHETVNKYIQEDAEQKYKELALPLYHTTDLNTFKYKILPDGKLRPITPCSYMNNENLLFFFVGKAPYYPKEYQKDSFKTNNPPVTLFYHCNKVSNSKIKRLICFDSGAHNEGKYYDSDKTKPPLNIFSLENPNQNQINACIHVVYSSLENYLENNIELYFDKDQYHLSALLGVLDKLKTKKTVLDADFGPQAYTLEVCALDDIELPPCGLIFPLKDLTSEIDEEDHWKTIFGEHPIELVPYELSSKLFQTYENMRTVVVEYTKSMN